MSGEKRKTEWIWSIVRWSIPVLLVLICLCFRFPRFFLQALAVLLCFPVSYVLFCSKRRLLKSRRMALAVCVLLFGIYHVWQYALSDPLSWLYALQYVPIGILLCRCYEKTETIWTSIFLHMTVNSISLWMLTLARELMS